MSDIHERKITQAYAYITERICDDVNPILNKLIEKRIFHYTIKDVLDSESKLNSLVKSDILLRRILDKNAGKDFLAVLNERGRYRDIFQKICNQDESREETFRCECCEMASKVEDKLGEMRADYERRLQQIQDESKRRREEDREEFEKKRKQDWEKMLKIIKTPRRYVKCKAINQKSKEKRKRTNRQKAESGSSEVISLKAETASPRNRIEELQRTVLMGEQETNYQKVELDMLQKQFDDKENSKTMQFFILLCAF